MLRTRSETPVETTRMRGADAVAAEAMLSGMRESGVCPSCGAIGPIAPLRSEFIESEEGGLGHVLHHWRCARCRHGWSTSVHMPIGEW
ncbi:hypothetical protein [Rhodoplanes roseus]|uniref:Uncharacterized protein n=1 Tax=Rhodoplanes roseus TaxID=29409 RepID=A0A327L5X8_9BRAD|nr:hypothetical protein [Rhodoplanes roseus]RAI45283.1 hypothetical protein CH341_04610 [Rhodoplanes roseus]